MKNEDSNFQIIPILGYCKMMPQRASYCTNHCATCKHFWLEINLLGQRLHSKIWLILCLPILYECPNVYLIF